MRILTIILITSVLVLVANAHVYHTSLTRIDYNSKENSVEITIQTFTHDLEAAIEKRIGKRINLEKSSDAKQVLLDYLNERLVIKNKSGEQKKLQMVGIEIQADAIFVYAETQMPEGLEAATLENRVLLEQFGDQVNLVTVRFNDAKQDLVFKAGDEAQTIQAKKN